MNFRFELDCKVVETSGLYWAIRYGITKFVLDC